jgi:hypothetical protein
MIFRVLEHTGSTAAARPEEKGASRPEKRSRK